MSVFLPPMFCRNVRGLVNPGFNLKSCRAWIAQRPVAILASVGIIVSVNA